MLSSMLRTGASALALAMLALALPQAGRAQDADTQTGSTRATKPKTEEIVVTGERVPDRVPLTTQFAVGTITTEEVRNLPLGPTDTVQTLLNRQPSLIAYANGPLGIGTTVYFRAFNSSQFSETYDGVALNDAFNGGVTNQASVVNNVLLLPIDLDGVEVNRGVNNPAVNSYNSLGGTVNYVSRLPTKAFGGDVGGSYGSFNSSEEHFSINTGSVHGIENFLEVTNQHSDGWNPRTPAANIHAYYSGLLNDGTDHPLNLVLIFNHNTSRTPFTIPVDLLNANGGFYQWPLDYTYEHDADTNYLGILSFTNKFSDHVLFEQKLFAGVNDYKRTSFSNPAFQEGATLPDGSTQIYNLENNPTGFPFWLNRSSYPNGPSYDPRLVFGTSQSGTDYHFYGYRASTIGYTPKVTITAPHNTITVGGNVTLSWLHSREYFYGAYNMPKTPGYNDAWDENDQRLLASAYVQDEISLFNDRVKITPAFKYLYADTRDVDAVGFYYPIPGAVRDEADYIAPTIGVSVTPIKHIALFFAYGQNIRFPDISAFYGAFQTNQANGQNLIVPVRVNPEYVKDYEAGVRVNLGGLSGTANVYREDFTNTFISIFDPTTSLSTTANGGGSRYQGVELTLTQDFGKQAWGDLRLNVAFAYNEAKFTQSFNSVEAGGSVLAGTPLANVPDYLLSAGAVYAIDGWRAELRGRYVGKQYIDQQNFLQVATNHATIPSYYLIDLDLAKVIPIGYGPVKSLRLAFEARNLTNKYYYNNGLTDQDVNGNNFLRAQAAAPRSFLGSVSVMF